MKNNCEDADGLAKIVWDYLLMHHKLQTCDTILTLCSMDERVAEFAAELLLKGYSEYLLFSGGVAHDDDLLRARWSGSEAAHFAEIALAKGVPKDKLILEDRATNTGENIRFSHTLLQAKGIVARSLLLVQKPYMERRTVATFEAQWPDKQTTFVVSSPPLSFDDYFDEYNPKDKVISVMVGDLQRIREYPKLGFQSQQVIPSTVWQAYEQLVERGYTAHLLQSKPHHTHAHQPSYMHAT